MENEKQKEEELKDQQKQALLKSDPETLHTPDPQEHMEGPVSSLMHGIAEGFDDKDAEKKIKEGE
ncbi:MAG: hypothetical protein ABI594_18290 [Ginsengibacter sp.]